ncbi:FAD-dependent thymidylate synthase [Corynebacterium sp. 22KM0430]|uniref:FAD-dependent thymidylate synthase n=1 Tax=Corynebacterium sp. 22KM0430 TaxID=2989735 RepID=UPI0029CA970B|nr:FAD-dependent thymidylate synthase [Corynebacterium sp. 22KM0430]WPF65280.1 FAD-dependent thymidylate synthase [Corynebacterium sp. 22KM0430]
MVRQARLRVQVLSAPTFTVPADTSWHPGEQATAAEAVVEFAGRLESGSLDHPRPRTQGTEAYLRHLQEVARWDLMAHATATVYITGLSRRCVDTLSCREDLTVTRATPPMGAEQVEVVIPPAIEQDEALRTLFLRTMDEARFAYEQFVEGLKDPAQQHDAVWAARQAHQAAHAVVPVAVATSLVVTASMQAWRAVMLSFGAEHADSEWRSLATALLTALRPVAPALFIDVAEVPAVDGPPGVESAYGVD